MYFSKVSDCITMMYCGEVKEEPDSEEWDAAASNYVGTGEALQEYPFGK